MVAVAWLPVIGVAGAVFAAFAGVEWGLARQAEAGDHRWRAGAFLAASLACFLVFGTGRAMRPALVAESGPAAAIAALEREVADALALARDVQAGARPPAAEEVRRDRGRLMAARRQLARRDDPASRVRPLENQADALLGVAYLALGDQWRLEREGRWSDADRRARITAQLGAELERWERIRACVAEGRHDCSTSVDLTPAQAALRDFNLWFHPYALEMIRFQETEPALVDTSPTERQRIAAALAEAARELKNRHAGPGGQPVLDAAAGLLRAALQALQQEGALVESARWDAAGQEIAYQPVRKAVEAYSQTLFCSARVGGAVCTQSRGGTR